MRRRSSRRAPSCTSSAGTAVRTDVRKLVVADGAMTLRLPILLALTARTHTCIRAPCFTLAGNKHLRDLHVLDTEKLEWSQPEMKGALPPGLRGHTANLIGTKMFLFGGALPAWDGREGGHHTCGLVRLSDFGFSLPTTRAPDVRRLRRPRPQQRAVHLRRGDLQVGAPAHARDDAHGPPAPHVVPRARAAAVSAGRVSHEGYGEARAGRTAVCAHFAALTPSPLRPHPSLARAASTASSG